MKDTLKMENRMKLVFEKNGNNSFALVVSGKSDTDFHFSKKRAGELVACIRTSMTGVTQKFIFNKSISSSAGQIVVAPVDDNTFKVIINTKDSDKAVFNQVVNRKTLKKICSRMEVMYK